MIIWLFISFLPQVSIPLQLAPAGNSNYLNFTGIQQRL
jgi:hypothetical protein